MNLRVRTQFCLVVGLLGVASVMPLQSATIFDNSVSDLLTRFDPGTREVGDQIVLASTERYLTHFDFEYWGHSTTGDGSTFAGAVQARVRFFENNGTPGYNGYLTPSDMFYQSAWFAITPTDGPGGALRATMNFDQAVDFPDGGLLIPVNEMTWTVQFQGMGGGDTVGVDIYSPPVSGYGSDYPDYWENSGTEFVPAWTLLTNTVPMDFAARMYANATIPEPSSLTLSLLGGLGILAFARRLRRN